MATTCELCDDGGGNDGVLAVTGTGYATAESIECATLTESTIWWCEMKVTEQWR